MIIEYNREMFVALSKTEQDIIRFINENETRLSEMSIVDIGFETFSSPATVSRAIRKCGLGGFNELRYRINKANATEELDSINEIMRKSMVEVTHTIEQISLKDIQDITDAIIEARRIYVLARGLSELPAKEFNLKLQLMDHNAMEITDPNIMRSISRSLHEKDILIVFSLNGSTQELVESARNAQQTNNKVITICCSQSSPLLEYSAHHLIGYKHAHISIKEFEVTSRIPLYVISRILIDHMVNK